MEIVLNTSQPYALSELAQAVSNSGDDLIYIVKQVDGVPVSYAITREQFIQGISGGASNSKFIISGGLVWSGTGMVFDSSEISYSYYGTTNTIAATSITLDDGDVDARFDVFAVDTDTNTIVVIKGTPDANPIQPPVGATQIFIQSVLVGAGATTPSLNREIVYRDGTEWDTSTTTLYTGTVDFQSTVDPYSSTYCVDMNIDRRVFVSFTEPGGGVINLSDFPVLGFRIKLGASLGARYLILQAKKDGIVISNTIVSSFFGLDSSSTDWQLIVMPSVLLGGVELDELSFNMAGGINGTLFNWFLDEIVFSSSYLPASPDKIQVFKNGNFVGEQPSINLIEGTNVTFDIVDDAVGSKVDITINSSGGGGGGGVDSVSGTTNEITIGGTAADPIVALAAAVLTSLGLADSSVQSVVAGTNVTVDATDPINPIVNVQITESGEAIYFLEDEADPSISGYKVMDNPAQLLTESFVTETTIAEGQLIQAWITDLGLPGVTFIPSGVWLFKINAFKTGGTKEIRLYNEMYLRDAGGAETLLGTTANSTALTDTEESIASFNIYIEGFALLETDRLVTKTRMTLVGGGSDPTSVTIGYSGSTAARFSLPSQGGQSVNNSPTIKETFTPDGVSMDFILSQTPSPGYVLQVFAQGTGYLIQEIDFTVTGNTVTFLPSGFFSGPESFGGAKIVVYYNISSDGGGFSGNYNDLTNKPDLSVFDNIDDYVNFAGFPATGVVDVFYVANDTGILYRWNGSTYVIVSGALALGTTSSTAHRGDHGAVAYTHSLLTTGNPHNVTKANLGLGAVENYSLAQILNAIRIAENTFTKGQSMTIITIDVVAGNADFSLTEGNKFYVRVTANTQINVPSNIAALIGQNVEILVENTTGSTVTFAAGYGAVKGDVPTTTAGNFFLVNMSFWGNTLPYIATVTNK